MIRVIQYVNNVTQSYELNSEVQASAREREMKEHAFWPVHFYYDLLQRGLRRYHSVRTCHAHAGHYA